MRCQNPSRNILNKIKEYKHVAMARIILNLSDPKLSGNAKDERKSSTIQ